MECIVRSQECPYLTQQHLPEQHPSVPPPSTLFSLFSSSLMQSSESSTTGTQWVYIVQLFHFRCQTFSFEYKEKDSLNWCNRKVGLPTENRDLCRRWICKQFSPLPVLYRRRMRKRKTSAQPQPRLIETSKTMQNSVDEVPHLTRVSVSLSLFTITVLGSEIDSTSLMSVWCSNDITRTHFVKCDQWSRTVNFTLPSCAFLQWHWHHCPCAMPCGRLIFFGLTMVANSWCERPLAAHKGTSKRL